MRLFEAILNANNRAVAGDTNAGLRPADYAEELPIIALTCIDTRLNVILPSVLGVPQESFIWLRNAGNIVTGPLSSTMRSLALACAVKGGREIAIIGHTDCQVCKTTTMQLLDRFKALGVERSSLPDNMNEYFGLFATERQNVIRGCDIVRHSPLIGPKIAVHGLLVDIETGKLEWVVNGYNSLQTQGQSMSMATQPLHMANPNMAFEMGEMKFPEAKIGEGADKSKDWLTRTLEEAKEHAASKKPLNVVPAPQPPPVPPQQPTPPPIPRPIRVKSDFRKR